MCVIVLFTDDFESKFNFHPVEDLPPPEEYRHFSRVYPSKGTKGRAPFHHAPSYGHEVHGSVLLSESLFDKVVVVMQS